MGIGEGKRGGKEERQRRKNENTSLFTGDTYFYFEYHY